MDEHVTIDEAIQILKNEINRQCPLCANGIEICRCGEPYYYHHKSFDDELNPLCDAFPLISVLKFLEYINSDEIF